MEDSTDQTLRGRSALVTGASRRIGAAIVRDLHAAGARVGIHYHQSADAAADLCQSLNDIRPQSAATFKADLIDVAQCSALTAAFTAWAGSLSILVNNASTFYPTPLGSITEDQWNDLLGTNLKGPLFLTQSAAALLAKERGAVINIVDIHARRPLKDHPVYGAAKAGLEMLTRALAKDMAPDVRVNGVAPGAILWPQEGMTDKNKMAILQQIPLQCPGEPQDIAECVLYLATAKYVTGQIIAVDGGRSTGW
ncbi:MAG: pteridine reductase [Woeseia sp.]|nr:pteridine reductase [Woeseia sp.]